MAPGGCHGPSSFWIHSFFCRLHSRFSELPHPPNPRIGFDTGRRGVNIVGEKFFGWPSYVALQDVIDANIDVYFLFIFREKKTSMNPIFSIGQNASAAHSA